MIRIVLYLLKIVQPCQTKDMLTHVKKILCSSVVSTLSISVLYDKRRNDRLAFLYLGLTYSTRHYRTNFGITFQVLRPSLGPTVILSPLKKPLQKVIFPPRCST